MLAAAEDLGLGTLVETHSEEDLAKALATDAPVVGVNARDLETLEVDVERALALLAGGSVRTRGGPRERDRRHASTSSERSTPAPGPCWWARR